VIAGESHAGVDACGPSKTRPRSTHKLLIENGSQILNRAASGQTVHLVRQKREERGTAMPLMPTNGEKVAADLLVVVLGC
jgi:hypothetical protein